MTTGFLGLIVDPLLNCLATLIFLLTPLAWLPSSAPSPEVAAVFYFPDSSEIHPSCRLPTCSAAVLDAFPPLLHTATPLACSNYIGLGLIWVLMSSVVPTSKPSHPTNISPVSLVVFVTYIYIYIYIYVCESMSVISNLMQSFATPP
jgi:hypothetical protein